MSDNNMRRFYLGLFFAGVLIALAAASLERSPGYMDADYYYAGALRIAAGQGASEPYLWNYLNQPGALPAPSFSYWMPLTSLVAAVGLAVAQPLGFWGARLGFILLAGCIAPLTAHLSLRLTGRPGMARLAGLLALFPGFYLAYLPTTDAFALTMVLGGLFFILTLPDRATAQMPDEARLFGLGLLAGLLHLTRADGLLWLGGAGLTALIFFRQNRRPGENPLRLAAYSGAVLTGYGLVMVPWMIHNLRGWGSPFPPGGARALFIIAYEQTMLFPASLLTPQAWLAAGWGPHLRAWWDALVTNLQTMLAVQGSIILLPFILAGVWRLRGCLAVKLGMILYGLILAVMTLAFPFAGANGGFFHSGAALQPLWWAAAPLGVEGLMLAYTRWRRMGQPGQMVRFMSGLLVAVLAMLSGLLYFQRVVGTQPGGMSWDASARHYQAVEARLVESGAPAESPVLVNNPPGYWLVSRRPALVIPDGDEQMLLAAARQYGAGYLVLETNNPAPLGALYHGRVSPPELQYLDSVGETRLYRINLAEP